MSGRIRPAPTSGPGFALIAVMWVVIAAGLILLGVRTNAWVHVTMARNELASVQAHWLARAGIEQALAVLEDDSLATDSADDGWFDDEELFKDAPLAGGTFSVTAAVSEPGRAPGIRFGLSDHSARVNVNPADANILSRLPRLDTSQVESILDWIDKDDTARSGGAETGYYQQLRHPYRIRNGPMQTVRELLLVKGIDDEVFYGPGGNPAAGAGANEAERTRSHQPSGGREEAPGLSELVTVYTYELNQDAAGDQRLDMNTADKETMVQKLNFSDALAEGVVKGRQSRKFASLMDLLNVRADTSGKPSQDTGKVSEISLKWLADHFDELAVTGDQRLPGKINVNTAGEDALMSLPQMTPDAADAIIARRSSSRGPYRGVGELLGGGLSEDQFKSIAERCTVRSNVFEIHSSGVTAWGIRQEIVAVVDRGAEPATILYWYQSE